MPTNERSGPEDRKGIGASGESEITDLYRGFSREESKGGKAIPNHATLSVWAAALILCIILVFGLHQLGGRLQGIQDTLQQVGQENKLLLEGLDELLVRVDLSKRDPSTASLFPEPVDEDEASHEEEGGSGDLARKYKIYYRAKDGEDLTAISEKFSVSEDQLRLWNALKATDSLIPGQVLVINKSTKEDKPVKVALAPSPPDHPGEARQEGPAAKEPPPQGLASKGPPRRPEKRDEPAVEETTADEPGAVRGPAESLDSDAATSLPEMPGAVADAPVDETVHVVLRGESLSNIGQMYGVSWLDLANLNRIEPPGTIYVGQRLRIPGPFDRKDPTLPMGEVKHRVKRGENLYRIGLAYDVGWEQIARANGISRPSQLHAGQVLKIPVAKGGPEN